MMADLTVSAAWHASLILWAPMADLTVSAAMAGLTNVLWATMACGRLWPVGTDGCPHLLLWVPMADLTDVSPSPVGAHG